MADAITIEFSTSVWIQQFVKGLRGQWFIGMQTSVNGQPMDLTEYYGPFETEDSVKAIKLQFDEGSAIMLGNFKKTALEEMRKPNG
jgi:hypothetical protein